MSLPVVLEPGSSWGARFSAYRSALAAAQKPGAGVPAYMRWVNRGAARVVAAACAAFGWTPNFVSFISVCFSTLGLIVLVAFEPAWWTGLIVGTALAVGFMFDSADGQVSRVTGRPRRRVSGWIMSPTRSVPRRSTSAPPPRLWSTAPSRGGWLSSRSSTDG